MQPNQIPLLEFDQNKTAKFSPAHFGKKKILPERCVISFSKIAVSTVARQYGGEIKTQLESCTVELPVYVFPYEGEEVALVCGFLGSAGAAAQIEELVALGAKKIVACGAAGALTKNPLGAVVIVEKAVRDEGASFHYVPPSYEIEANADTIKRIQKTLSKLAVPYQTGKTWTTDGLYRETDDKIALRQSQGCLTVEMEASAMLAVSRFHGISFGQLLYCGDDLSGIEYDHREFFAQADIKTKLTELALQCVVNL